MESDAYVMIVFSNCTALQREVLVALLGGYGCTGFEEDDAALKAYIPEHIFYHLNLSAILDEIPLLRSITFTHQKLLPTNWNILWESNFTPVIIAEKLYVRATFHPPRPDLPIELVINPKMSFGTGHHATTYMMAETMLQLSFQNKIVLDWGCGTGILAIIASKLGAAAVWALDESEWAYQNCLENCNLNKVHNIFVVHGNDHNLPNRPFDIILANIGKEIIASNMSALAKRLIPGGILCISGFLSDDAEELRSIAVSYDIELLMQKEKEDWVCMQLIKADLVDRAGFNERFSV